MASLASWFGLKSFPDAAVPLVYAATSAVVKLAMWSTACGGRSRFPAGRAVSVGRVTGLSIYPVKSMDGMHDLKEAECTFTGLKLPGIDLYDRSVYKPVKFVL